jgi:hypothetical protein
VSDVGLKERVGQQVSRKRVIHYFSDDTASGGDIVCSMIEALFGVIVHRFPWDLEGIVERDVKQHLPILCIFAAPLQQSGADKEVWEKVRELVRGTPALWLTADRGQDLRFLRTTKVVYTEEGGTFESFIRAVHKITKIVPRVSLNM